VGLSLRPLVKRGLPPTPGANNLIIVKAGEWILDRLEPRLQAMVRDLEKYEFFWDRLTRDPQFNESVEWKASHQLQLDWKLREGVDLPDQYRAKMNKLRIFCEHFVRGNDYELTVSEIVEILA